MPDRPPLEAGVVDPEPQPPIVLDDVWLKFNLRLYRQRLTFRGVTLTGLQSLLRRRRRSRNDEFWALRGIALTVDHGEVLGVIGSNGAGKSTLLRVIAQIYSPDRGRVQTHGTIATLLSFGAGFDLRRPGRENIYKNGILLGLSRPEIDERVDAITEMSDLGRFIDAPVMTYSSGMRARLGFSIAVTVNPDILLVDEVVGVGDAKFRSRVGTIFDQLSAHRKTIVFVTHNLGLLDQYCTRAVWLENGQVRLDGPSSEVKEAYLSESGPDAKTKRR